MRSRAFVSLAALIAASLVLAGSTSAAGAGSARAFVPTATATQLCGLDRQWLEMAIEGDRFEIAGGRIALDLGQHPKVSSLGQTLITDHTKSLASTSALARRLGVAPPTEPSPSQTWELRELRARSGQHFDLDYADLEVLDHMQDIQDASMEWQFGCNAQVRMTAKNEIPVLQKHLALARAALAQAKGG